MFLLDLHSLDAHSTPNHFARQALYKKGGLISVTSRILVVDMLQADIPTELITGIIVLHAEKWVIQIDISGYTRGLNWFSG